MEKITFPRHTTQALKPLFVAGLMACTLLPTTSFAQGFDFGLKTVIQTSALLNTVDQAAGAELDVSQKVGVAYGIGAGYSFNKRMGVELDLLLSADGESYKGVVANIDPTKPDVFCDNIKALATLNKITFTGNYTADVVLDYLKIPILFRLTGVNTKKIYFGLFAGPQVNLLTSVKYKINGQDATLSGANASLSDMYKKTTLDAILGVGAGFNVSEKFAITAHLRLDYGLGDAENKSATVNGTDYYGSGRPATHNASGGLMIGLNYKLVKKEKAAAAPAKTKK